MPACPSCGEDNPERARFCLGCGSPVAVPVRREVRKTVTVLFSDLSGSTALGERLDAESVVRALAAYFDAMRIEVERHGGTVAKFIGDAIMAVFGLPQVHEDDALRAVRAAIGMGEALTTFNEGLEARYGVRLAMRMGIYTGEVFAGEQEVGSSLALGDPVNTAARLEQAATAGEVLLGDPTYRLVRDAVVVEPVEPVAAKGKAEPVRAWRLVSVKARAEGHRRRLDAPLVGRERELDAILAAHAEAVRTRRCRAVAVVGAAGMGKSRLMAELRSRLAGTSTVLTGRCLPYGEGITLWPMAEVVRSALGIQEADDPAMAMAKLAGVLAHEPDGEAVAARVAEVIGLAPPTGGAEEVPWALRRFVETLTHDRPLALVVDDLHWGEPGLVDVVEHLATRTQVPLLLVCVARPEVAEVHPGLAERTGAEVIRLEPLGQAQAEALLENLIGAADLPVGFADRILTAADGNPLFVEELLGMLIDDGLLCFEDGRWRAAGEVAAMTLPPSISAVLTARLDRLPGPERVVVESASVVGQEFELSAVTRIVPDDVRPAAPHHLDGLVQRELVSPSDPTPLDDEAFRFEHLLIRDAAYEAMAKAARAQLHEAVAGWLVETAGERVTAYEAIVGYHLERAHRLKEELGPLVGADATLAARAADRLGRAGRRSLAQEDFAGAANLLGRAVELATDGGPERLELLLARAEALVGTGDLAGADGVLTDAVQGAERLCDERLRAHGVVGLSNVRRRAGGLDPPDVAEVEEAIRVFTAHRDERGLALAWSALARPLWDEGRSEQGDEHAHRALVHARAAGDRRTVVRLLGNLAMSAVLGPLPTSTGVSLCQRYRAELQGSQVAEASLGEVEGLLLAMRGEPAAARARLARSRTIFGDLGMVADETTAALDVAEVEWLAGNDAVAEDELRACYRALSAMGERNVVTTVAARLALVLLSRGDDAGAEEFAAVAEAGAAEDDVVSRLWVMQARATLLARAGRLVEAEALARRAVGLAATTDWLNDHAAALVDLAEVVATAGAVEDAAELLRDAVALYERKESLVGSERARARRAALS